MSTPAIQVENLKKVYRIHHQQEQSDTLRDAIVQFFRKSEKSTSEAFQAIEDISFEVQHGEVLGIIGRNGAGKSTLLKVLSRITEPTAGRIRLNGRVVSLLEVGTGFHPELTGRENIFLNGAILGMSRAEIRRKFDEIVDFAGVEKFIDTPVKRYSSGMYVRLAFSVAAHLEPEILLIDEVLAVGDVNFQKKCLGRMKDIAREGRTVIFISHQLAALENLCPRCLWLDAGRVVFDGPTRDTIERYLSSRNQTTPEPTDRPADALIQSITFKDSTGAVNTIRPGEPCEALIELNLGDLQLDSPQVGIGINSMSGQRLTSSGSYFSTSNLPALTGKCIVRCAWEDLPLSPGSYQIKVAVGTAYEDLESVEDLTTVQVVASDYYGNGRMPAPHQGVFLTQSSWNAIHS